MKFRYVLGWLFIFVVGSLITSFIIYPENFQSFKSNIKNIIPTGLSIGSSSSEPQEPIISSCIQEFNKYTGIAEQKYNQLSYNRIKVEKMNNDKQAGEFWDLYKSPLDMSYSNKKTMQMWNFKYPIVMIAGKLSITDGSLPFVVYCNSEGKLSEDSKKVLNP